MIHLESMLDEAVYSKALEFLEYLIKDNNLDDHQRNLIHELCVIGYYFLDNHDEVLRHLDSMKLKHLESFFYPASTHQRSENFYNSKEDYNKALELVADAPIQAAVLARRGALLVRMGQYNEALEDYNKALELVADAPSRAAVLAGRGVVLVRMGQDDKALEDYNKALELVADAPSRAAALAGRGVVLVRMGQDDKALEDYNEALKLVADASSRAAALAGRGVVLVRMEQYDKALGDLNEAIELAEAIANKAASPTEHGAALNAAVQLDFDRSKMYIWRGSTYMSKKQCIKALKDFDRAIELDPANAQALYWRGLAHLEMRSYLQAENDFNVASRLEPRYAAPLAALAEVRLRVALETLIQAIYLCGVNPEIHPQHLINEIRRRIGDLQRLFGSSTGTA